MKAGRFRLTTKDMETMIPVTLLPCQRGICRFDSDMGDGVRYKCGKFLAEEQPIYEIEDAFQVMGESCLCRHGRKRKLARWYCKSSIHFLAFDSSAATSTAWRTSTFLRPMENATVTLRTIATPPARSIETCSGPHLSKIGGYSSWKRKRAKERERDFYIRQPAYWPPGHCLMRVRNL